MGIKQVITYISMLIVPFVAVSQVCGTMERNITEKERKYYLADSSYSLPELNELLPKIKPDDTALVRLIIEKGRNTDDYISFFKRKGIVVRIIAINEFSNLPKDTVILTRKERRRLKKFNKLSEKSSSLLIKEKSTTRIERKLRKTKFIRLQHRRWAAYPFLFKMYPIYTYQDYTLFMYSIFTEKWGTPFIYEICKTP